jgi:ATP-binding cassette subfamily F protein 3
LIQVDRASKSYGGRTLFTDLSWQLFPGKRIGLIGPNGAGKTTLFRFLVGQEEPDAGRVVLPGGVTIGLLPQEIDRLSDRPAIDVVLDGRAEMLMLEATIAELTAAIEEQPDNALELSTKLGEAEEAYTNGGGYTMRAEAKTIMGGMGFEPGDHTRMASEFSGGWRMRLLLSKLLLQRPDVLLLDEPTNHLDVPSLEWIEGFLASYEGTVVVISHDRYFLNRLVNEIAAFEPGGFFCQPGNYDKYLAGRELRLEQLKKDRAQQDRKIKQTERFIERFRYKNTKARQVQSRVKQLEKIERLELPSDRRSISFRFPEAPRAGRVMSRLEKAVKRYGDLIVYDELDLSIERGEHVSLVGPNGGGKSTLLKLIVGEIEPDGGKVTLGHNTLVGYYAQHQIDSLDLNRTLLEEMQAWATEETRTRCRTILGAFLFSGDDVDKRIQVLSGGERARIALAKLLLRPSNMLLLDEPTNHLDMISRDVLQEALAAYSGTIVFVSHDRGFINGLATRVLHVEDKTCVSYPGDYEYYKFKRSQEGGGVALDRDQTSKAGSKGKSGDRAARKEQKRREAQQRNELSRRTGDLRKKVAETEKKIASREAKVEEIEKLWVDPELYNKPGEIERLSERHAKHKKRLVQLYDKWTRLGEQIEEIEGQVEG